MDTRDHCKCKQLQKFLKHTHSFVLFKSIRRKRLLAGPHQIARFMDPAGHQDCTLGGCGHNYSVFVKRAPYVVVERTVFNCSRNFWHAVGQARMIISKVQIAANEKFIDLT